VDSFSLYQRTLACALRVAGSERKLARRLLVPEADLRRWLEGGETPPKSVFLAAVDVLVDPDPAPSPPERRTTRRAAPAKS
jgi:hypothetical protein